MATCQSGLEPDLLIGIDLGTSCTGVSFLNRIHKNSNIKTFQGWGLNRVESKVPTKMRYAKDPFLFPHPRLSPLQWGFQCSMTCSSTTPYTAERFKIELNADRPGQRAQDQVHRLYTDYLNCLYDQLEQHFQACNIDGNKDWRSCTIHFFFSYPATWEPKTRNKFCEIIANTQFKNTRSTIECSLSEPDAVAIYELAKRDYIQSGQDILVIDAGGGTVDICVLNVKNTDAGKLEVAQLKPIQGTECGSTFIDVAFQRIIQHRLEELVNKGVVSDISPAEEASSMIASDDFQSTKCGLREDGYRDGDVFWINIPNVVNSVQEPDQHVLGGRMSFTFGELRAQFNKQVEGITMKLDKILFQLIHRPLKPEGKIDHIILSGGLGKSDYVEARLQDYLKKTGFAPLRNAKLHRSDEPQLSVSLGLLEHAKQALETVTPPIQVRSPCSVGIRSIRKLPRWYDSIISSTKGPKFEPVVREKAQQYDKFIGKDRHSVKDYIDWFIKWDDELEANKSVMVKYSCEFELGSDKANWSSTLDIITSSDEKPPIFFEAEGNAARYVGVKVNLSRVSDGSIQRRSSTTTLKDKRTRVYEVFFFLEAKIEGAEMTFRALDFTTKNPLHSNVKVDLSTFPSRPENSIDERGQLPIRHSDI